MTPCYNIEIICENNNLHSIKRLIKEAGELGLKIKCHNIYDQSYLDSSNNASSQIILPRYSGVRYDDYDITFIENKQLEGAISVSSPESLKNYRQKCTQHIIFKRNNIPHIPTLSLRGNYSKSALSELAENSFTLQSWDKESFIVKMSRGNQGKGVTLLRGIDSLQSFNETFHAIGDQRYIIQPQIKIDSEYRILMVNNQILGALKKVANDDFRANAKRSDLTFISPQELSPELATIAKQCSDSSNLFYMGIDIIKSDNEYYVLEINPCPGFESFEKESSLNVAKTLLEEISKKYL